MEFIKPRHQHEEDLWLWNVIAHEQASWAKRDGLGFADYYFVQHKIFKKMKRVKCFGYRAEEHPEYKNFCEKHLS